MRISVRLLSSMQHRTVFVSNDLVKVALPLGEKLQRSIHKDGSFFLCEDHHVTKRSCIIGMFVLRPSIDAWKGGNDDDDDILTSMFDVRDWAYNYKGLDGGGCIANGSLVDAFRLSLHYGCTDAIIVGSNMVSTEGVEGKYTWQASGPAGWPHVAAVEPDLVAMIAETRRLWISMGYLSSRTQPANIVFTVSGERHAESAHDFLESHIFHSEEGGEVYILTSETGAMNIRKRAGHFGLQHRIDSMLIVSSPPEDPNEVDVQSIPALLYQKFDMRLVNNDGGQTVLQKFSVAGALSQINITLCRGLALKELDAIVRLGHSDEDFTRNVQLFFSAHASTPRGGADRCPCPSTTVFGHGEIPAAVMRPAAVLLAADDSVAVASFRVLGDFTLPLLMPPPLLQQDPLQQQESRVQGE